MTSAFVVKNLQKSSSQLREEGAHMLLFPSGAPLHSLVGRRVQFGVVLVSVSCPCAMHKAAFSRPRSVVDSLNGNSAVLPLPILAALPRVLSSPPRGPRGGAPCEGCEDLEDKDFAGVINPWQGFHSGC